MDSILKGLKNFQGIAQSSESGEALGSAGNIDADTLCAVSSVSAGTLAEIGDLLSAGRLERWYLVTEQHTYYVSERAGGRLVGVGEALKNPETASKTLSAAALTR